MKKITLLIVLLLTAGLGFGQTMLAQLDFETPGGYSTSIPEFSDKSVGSGRDYFIRTDGTEINGVVFNLQTGYYFAAQDINGEGASPIQTLLIDNINISGYSNLEFRIHLAEDDDGTNQDWDNNGAFPDFVHISYDLDNASSFSDLLWIEPNGSGSNNEPAIDTDFDGTGDGTLITNTFSQFIENIAGTGDLLDIEIEFSFDSGDEDIAIDNIEIWGTLAPCAGITTTWDAITSTWDNGTPTISDNAILNGNYDTATYGSFSACSLVVNSGTLIIGNNTFVEVQNDLTAIGNVTVQPQGSFIQNNDLSSVTGSGTIQVFKETAPMREWYEYTYWSSPVQNETFDALIETNPSRRYVFNGQNFLDATAETGNNNATLPGQDDIDDNGDDWSWVSGTTIMQPGIGYGATLTEFAYNIAPGGASKQITLAPFVGLFNNGVYNVPIYRNDSETADNNWNMIGNPYPSAIDVDMFLASNTNIETNTVTNPARAIDGAIYLWSQDTDPSPIANGNQGSNFSDSDFAIINGSTAIAGGDGIVPSRFIPSGQAFFVTMSNSAPATLVSGDVFTTNVTFSNSMRVASTSANSQFFKNSSSKGNATPDKLWVNLTSDKGAFNQTAVAYIDGATNNFDGAYFDALKPSGIVTAAILYTNIEGSDKKLAIQGKAANSINEDEIISLGFKTNTDEVTLLTISIDHVEGSFLSNNTIYLKDNLLNKLHNLTDSDYTFTSEVGEFNQRFEIVFNANALSVNDITADTNALKIVELQDNRVQFSISNGLRIENIKIYDLLGRQLYNLNGSRSVEVFNLSNLNHTVYIAKVQLSNGALITKKAIKR